MALFVHFTFVRFIKNNSLLVFDILYLIEVNQNDFIRYFTFFLFLQYISLPVVFDIPRADAGDQVENTSSVSPACRKRRLKGRRYLAIVADTA